MFSKKQSKERKKISKPLVIGLYILNIAIVIGMIVGNTYTLAYSHIISTYLGHTTSKVVKNKDEKGSEYYKSNFKSDEERIKSGQELIKNLEAEGITMLKNDNQVLPIQKKTKVSLLGQSSVDLVYGGVGAGSVEIKNPPTLKDALEKADISVNPILWDFYQSGEGKSYRRKTPDVYGKGEFEINEVPGDVYTEPVKNSFKEYNDAAIVVISRSGGESSDLATKPLKSGSHYLELDKDEKNLLQMAQDNFEHVIVVLNTANALELNFLDEYNVDAAIWIGAVGETGVLAVGDILNGTTTPSGRLVDTYVKDVFSAPSMKNAGDYTIENSKVPMGNKYVTYNEGIYVGYRYYETRYEDVVLGNEDKNKYDYKETVQFPFGYGLSYTDFEYTDYVMKEEKDNFVFEVNVTNKGKASGKEVVQIYMQSPYTDYDKKHNIEKASVELVGFEKTDTLKPGDSEKVKIEVSKEAMKVYDAKNAKTYIVDSGDYYFSLGKNAHNALNNILAEKGKTMKDRMDAEGEKDLVVKVTQKKLDNTTYAKSISTGKEITNQFEKTDMQYYEPSLVYLSRSDWEGTYPTTFADGKWTAPEELIEDLAIVVPENKGATDKTHKQGQKKDQPLTAAMMIGVDYDDPLWDELLDQISVEEMIELVRMGGYATVAVPSISLPATVNKDGPAGISDTLVGGAKAGLAYPVQVLLASTWNKELIEEMGKAVGEDSLYTGVAGWYAPGINIHRTPFGGRNFEYFSEDPHLSGIMTASEIKGVESKGVFPFMKHFALNDTETNRIGGAFFSNEQALREIYLEPFELAVRQGDARGAMASMNRLGARWAGGHEGLMTNTLRDEWDFQGTIVTDQASFDVFAYEDIYEGLAAGTDLWLNTDNKLWKIPKEKQNPELISQLRDATHHIVYTVVNSNAMNGISSNDIVKKVMPLWQYWLIGADILVGLLVLIGTILLTKRVLADYRKK